MTVVRHATRLDAAGIARCLRVAFEEFRGAYTPAAFADTVPDEAGVLARMLDYSILMALVHGEIAGTIGFSVHQHNGHLRGMAVDPALQGLGIAKQLLDEAENRLLLAGCTRVSLDSTAPLERAIRFYARNGFAPTGRVRDFHGMSLYEYGKNIVDPQA